MCLRRRSVTYFTHDAKHRLVEADAGDGEFTCDGCVVAGAGLRYRCTRPGCLFQLHEACARRFPRAVKSVVHLEHRLKRYEDAGARHAPAATASSKCKSCCLAFVHDLANCIAFTAFTFTR
uniref:DC1 domain-containing protein n=1 Tax=Oryza brachyantha TaxID=4533 RepID=J3N9N3_ORYBR